MVNDKKLEKLSAFTLSPKNPALAQFKLRPTTKRQYFLYGMLAMSPVFAGFLIPLGLMQLYPALRSGWPGALTCLPPIIIGFSLAFPISASITYWMMRKQISEQSEQARKPVDLCDYVGVSYVNAFGIFDIYDTAWDRGWLSNANGRLVYSGRNSSFTLPLSSIVEVKECRTDLLATMMLPRVVIAWRHPDETIEHICIEVRNARSRKDFKLKNRELCKRLEVLVSAASEAELESSDAEWPFRSSIALKAPGFRPDEVRGEDRASAMFIAFLVYLALMAFWFAFDKAFHQELMMFLGSTSFMLACIAYFGVLRKRQDKRRRENLDKDGDR